MAAPPGNPADTPVHGRRAGRRDRAGSTRASTGAVTSAALPVPLDRLLLASLVVLVVASTWRFLTRHTMADGGLLVLALAAALLLTQAAALRVPAGSGRRTALVLVSTLACVVLVLLAPSFAWCAVPGGLRGARDPAGLAGHRHHDRAGLCWSRSRGRASPAPST